MIPLEVIASQEFRSVGRAARMSDHAAYAQLAEAAAPGSNLVHVRPLEGGASARIAVMEVAGSDGGLRKLVVRRHGDADRAANPTIARDEFRLLELLWGLGFAVARPVFVDEDARYFSIPCMVVAYLDGAPDYKPADMDGYLAQAAGQLAGIHGLCRDDHDLSFLPPMSDIAAGTIAAAMTGGSVTEVDGIGQALDVLARVEMPGCATPDVLLHGDFWPGNLILRDGHITGVIDWEDAATGNPLCDIANTRLEMLWAFGRSAMERFTRHYVETTGTDMADLAWWDLYTVVRHGPAFVDGWAHGLPQGPLMRTRLKDFADQAARAVRMF